ncbi:MAG: hypothetical protein JSV77_05935 [Dehalococcoidales bacterium]|nr:MAG: hypothetical protein JSV77_05935 [Dehalococcoidales bacterium]
MKASNRFVIISGSAIGILVVVAVVLVLTVGGGSTTLLPEDTPEGVVQRFFLALEDEDYEEAYSYLHSTVRAERSYQLWVPSMSWYQEEPAWTVTLGESSVVSYGATVEVTYTRFYPSTPILDLVDPIRTRQLIFHLQQEGDSWGIISPTGLWFLF